MSKTKDGFYKQIGTTEGSNSYLLLAGGDYIGFSSSSGSNTVVQRDANGFIVNSYFNTTSGGAERNASGLGYIAGFNTSDYYIRSYTSAAVKTWLGLGSNAYTSTAYLPLDGSAAITGNLMLKGSNGASTSSSIHLGIGDSDTGFKWISDGKVQMMANNVAIGEWTSSGMNWLVAPKVNSNVIWHAGNDGSGSGLDADYLRGYTINTGPITFNTIPFVGSAGVMEIGRYIDMHYDNTGAFDYSTRINCQGNYQNSVNLPTASGTLALLSDNVASATNISNTGTVNLASATESNAITITAPSYSADKPVKLLNFNWYADAWSIGNIRSGNTASNGLGIYLNSVEKFRFSDGALKIGTSTVWHSGNFTPSNYLLLSGGTLTGSLTVPSITNTGLYKNGVLDTHGEGNTIMIPFVFNDIAYLDKKGGSIETNYGSIPTSIVNGAPNYMIYDPSTLIANVPTGLTITLNLHKSFYWGNKIGVSFGGAGVRSKYIKIEAYRNDTSDWTTISEVSNNLESIYQIHYSSSSFGFSKLRFTFNDYAGSGTSGFRISGIWLYNYSSNGIKEIALGRDGGEIYGSIYPYATASNLDLGTSSRKWGNVYANNFNGALVGNANTATKLSSTRTFALTGDVTGTITSDLTSGVSIDTTIAANSVALGTDTTGNYAASVGVSGNGLTITGSAGEGTAFTVNSNATNANAGSTLVFRDASGNFSAGTITAALSGNASTATKVVATVTGTNNTELIRGNMADGDYFRILVGGTASNSGYAEIATADDGTEPIYVRQYSGVFTSLVRTATLLDASGNTIFPGSVTASYFYGTSSSSDAVSVDEYGTGAVNYIMFSLGQGFRGMEYDRELTYDSDIHKLVVPNISVTNLTTSLATVSSSMTVGLSVSAAGFNKTGYSDLYMLLAGGGAKLLSDFRLQSEKVLKMVFRGYFTWTGTNSTPSSSNVEYSDFCTSYSISRISTGRYRITFTGLKTTSSISADTTLQIFGAGRNINSDGTPCYISILNVSSNYFDIIASDDASPNDTSAFTLYINQML